MRSYRYLHLDVFTDRPFGGNQLAVFLDGRGLASETMQGMAREMAFSESTFVLPAERPDTDMRVRIFTPGHELPMAGHPTIGTAFALARAGVLVPGRQNVVFGLGVGPTPVALTWRHEDLSFAWMTQLNPTYSEPLKDRAGAAAALCLPAHAIAAGLPVQTISCGFPCVLVPLVSRHDVDQASLDASAYDRFRKANGLDQICVFLFSTEHGADGATAYSRMFAPDLGIVEDPATGGATGPLGCYLVEHGVVQREQAGDMVSRQGVKMGRPSDIHMSIDSAGGEIHSVRVGGEAVLVGEGTLYI
jgi:trans-2,3-dihydro-3-hydroxyanthranilate isomerase